MKLNNVAPTTGARRDAVATTVALAAIVGDPDGVMRRVTADTFDYQYAVNATSGGDVTPDSGIGQWFRLSAAAAVSYGTTSGTSAQGNDGRLSDKRDPNDHTHASVGTGAKLSQANTHESPDTDSASGSLHHTIGTGANQAAGGADGRLADKRDPNDHTHASVGTGAKLSQANTHESPDTDASAAALHHTIGTGANESCGGADARLTDARTPSAHAASHASGGTDALTWERWHLIATSKYTATPSSTSVITMSDTALMAVGLPVKFTISSTTYYAQITALSADTSITIAGATMGGDLTALFVGTAEMVQVVSLFVGSTYADGTEANLLAVDMFSPMKWSGPKAYLVAFSGVQMTVDTGTEPKINIQINNAAVSTADSNNGIQLSTSGTWVDNSAIAISTTNYDINRGEELEVDCTAAGGTGDAENLTVQCVFVLE